MTALLEQVISKLKSLPEEEHAGDRNSSFSGNGR